MKAIKTVLVVILGCAAAALISMAGTFPAAMQKSDVADLRAQTTTHQVEVMPGISTESMTVGIIFQ